jgi:hydrophobic/amphiphilic exporter-1 (mainly G- bacteria), HAE1 family
MNLAETSVKRPLTVVIITVLFIAVGVFLIRDIAVDMFPQVEPPFMMVQTTYPGASPQEVEQNVTERLEKQLSNVSGLEQMTSTSSAGTSRITLEFGYDRDMTDATNDIRDSLEIVANALPDGAGAPIIMKFDMMGSSIMRLTMNGDETPDALKRLAEDVVQPRLERLEGVASAEVTGGEIRAVRVDLSLNRLAAYGITASEVTSALSAQNFQMSSGSLTVDDTDLDLRVDERYTSLEEIGRTVVATVGTASPSSGAVNRSTVVRLEDVADVSEGTEDRTSAVYVDGRPAIQIEVLNESDTNTVQIADLVREALPAINAELPDGVAVELLYDETTYIDSVLNQVYTSAWQGVLLAMFVLFLFLRNWRTTLIIGFSIPVAIVVTLMFMYFFDLTLNMISLTGLILGLGMIVDNSIVILENIYSYRERGAKLRPAAILGSREMLTAIVASTLTTLSVFVPMIVWKDDLKMLGEIFSDLIFTVVIALTVSLVVAVTIVPALSANFIGIYTPSQRTIRNGILRRLDAFGARLLTLLEDGYTRALRFALRNRALVLTFVVTVLVLSVATFSQMGFAFAPQGTSDDTVQVELSMPVGTTIDRTEEVLLQMREIIEEEITGYENIIVTVGGTRSGGGAGGSIEITLPQPKDQTMSAMEIQEAIRPHVYAFPDAEFTFSAGRGFGAGADIDVTVASDNLDLAFATAGDIRDVIQAQITGVEDVQTDLDEGVPEYRIVIDKDRAAVYGLTARTVASSIDELVDGSTPTSYWDESTELDVIVQLAPSDRGTLPDLDALSIRTGSGELVALSNVASYELSQGPRDINREDETRVVHVTGDLVTGAAATEVMPRIEAAVATSVVIPDGVTVSFGGETNQISGLVGPLLTVFAVAILLIFGVMASQFESLSDPFIIFFSIPLLLIGVVGVYLVTGETFSLFSVIGMVVLSGIVVNNGIVLVDYTNLLRKRGTPLYQAVLEAGHSRLRPVLMTSFTTILGMVPLGFFPGEGTELVRPIGQTIVGGLAASTVITLFVTPIMYTLVNREKTEKVVTPAPVTAPIINQELANAAN